MVISAVECKSYKLPREPYSTRIRNGADILTIAALVSPASSAASAAARYPGLLRNATHRCHERVGLELGTCDASYNGYHVVALGYYR